MNKPVFVVEGKDDVSKLSSLGINYVIKTEGKFLSYDLFQFLKEVCKVREVVLLLDPDGPGKNIRERLHKELTNYKDVNVDKKRASAHRKIGVAETDFDYLKDLLSCYIEGDDEVETFSMDDFIDLGFISDQGKKKKDILVKRLHILANTNKSIINQINMLRLNKKEVGDILENE